MTNDANKSLDDYLAGDSVLSRRYREAGRDGPPEALDAAVLADARAAVEAESSVQPIRGWRWIGPLSTAAVVVLAAALVLEVVLSPELSAPIVPPDAVDYAGRPSDTRSGEHSVQQRERRDDSVAKRLRPSKLAQPPAAPPLDIADVARDAVGESENLVAPMPAAPVTNPAALSRSDTLPRVVSSAGQTSGAPPSEPSAPVDDVRELAPAEAPTDADSVKSEAAFAPYPEDLADASRASARDVSPGGRAFTVGDAHVATPPAPSPAAPAKTRTDERDNLEPVADPELRALPPRPAAQQAKPASTDRYGLPAREEANQSDGLFALGPTATQAAAMFLERLDTNPDLTDVERRDAALDEVRARHDVGDDTAAFALLRAALERWPDTDLPADFPLPDPRR